MIERFEKSPSLSFFKSQFTSEAPQNFLIEGLWDSPKALLFKLLQKETKRPIVILTGGIREDRLFHDFSFFGVQNLLEFPSWEILPGEDLSPSIDLIGKRMEVLNSLLTKKDSPLVLLAPLQAVLQKLPEQKELVQYFHTLKKGVSLPFDSLEAFFSPLGYQKVPLVSDKGQFAVRGGILDIFPAASPLPYRIEFFGNEIEQIRTFEISSQKSREKKETVWICPCQELSLLKNAKTLSFVTDFLKEGILVFDDLLALEDTYVNYKNLPGSKSPFFSSLEAFLDQTKHFSKIFLSKQSIEDLSFSENFKKVSREKTKFLQKISFDLFGLPFEAQRFFHPFMKISEFLSCPSNDSLSNHFSLFIQNNTPVVFLSESQKEEETLKQKVLPLIPNASFEKGYLSAGLVLLDLPIALFPESEFSHVQKIHRQQWRTFTQPPPPDFHSLSPGDLVVHFHNGIGKYLGIEKHPNNLGIETEFLVIEYANDAKLFVPFSQSHLVSRYIGSKEENPSFHTLGTSKWQTTKLHAEKQIVGYAEELLNLYATRSLERGFLYSDDSEEVLLFEREFPYPETEDQLKAIADFKKDLKSPKPMDRLICGDVGYGKTEVAMRAAFKVVLDGKKQVAVLVPTTVLASQHYETFKERMAHFPLTIEVLSRFHTPKQNREILERAKNGEIDILIGTHRILSKDVSFKELGLLIVDEEQRFGVRAKEHLKKFKQTVDCLSLSATPIPRTLYMSLIQIRDMSPIYTPPQDRLPIKVIICENDDETIKNALLRELSREGQAFFIHNRIESLFERTETIQKLLPQANIALVHGQMDPETVDEIFHQFKHGKIDILCATTLIENGIDIPNANTILIDRADQFGLADLYQLKGRVGRWNRSAYAYFLTPKNKTLTEISQKRLQALVESGSGYGGGIRIAMRDLEIRGAGNILGVQQSGQISSIGFHLYCKLLKRAVESLKNKKPLIFTETKMEFFYDAAIPETFIPETELRMELYHRFGEALSFKNLEELLAEIQDRFGKIPPPVLWLYHLSRIRLFASLNRFSLLKFQPHFVTAEQTISEKKHLQKTLPFPKVSDPAKLEEFALDFLKNQFVCTQTP